MRKLLLVVALLASAAPSFATGYFTPNPVFTNPAHPLTIQGALIDPKDIGGSRTALFVPTFTAKGPGGIDWTPAAVGGSMNAGKVTLDIAPLADVAPWAESGLLAVVPPSWSGLRSALSGQSSAISFSGGPVWEYRELNNKGYLMVFTGVALAW